MSAPLIEAARSARDKIYRLVYQRRRHLNVRGIKLILDDPAISPRMFYVLSRGYEGSEADLAERYLSADDRVLEVGGGIGFLMLICTKNIGIRDYFLVEANPELIPLIQKNLSANHTNDLQIAIRNAVLTGHEGHADFNLHQNFWSSSLAARDGSVKKVRVPARTLSSLVEEMPFRPNVLIMDIEGGEANIDPFQFELFDKILMELHLRIIGRERVDTLVRSLIQRGFDSPQEGVFLRHGMNPPTGSPRG